MDRAAPPAWRLEGACPADLAEGVVVWRQRRFGRHRLFVADRETGERLGWRDERTGELHVEDPADLARVHAGLKRWA